MGGHLLAAGMQAPPARQGLTVLLGFAGVLLLLIVLVHLVVRRNGGWRALGRGLRREAALTAAAFVAPFQAQLRYRRHLRLLVRLLGTRAGWADAEGALLWAATVRPDVRPYAALLGPEMVGVLVAAGPADPPEPPDPWFPDDADPRLWWIDRAHVAGPAAAGSGSRPAAAPLLVALGTDGEDAMLLDMMAGPAVMAVDGEPRTARAIVQAVAAQLDARLPAGSVTVAAGVSPQYSGPDPARAVATAARAAASGGPAFAVCPVAPLEQPVPDGVRLIVAGEARGRARLLAAGRDGLLLVHGTPLRPDAVALPPALARILGGLPPYAGHGGHTYAGLADAGSDLVEPLPPTAGTPQTSASGERATAPRPAVHHQDDDLIEPAEPTLLGAVHGQDDDLIEPAEPTHLGGVSATRGP
jgi:hypothetical protein